MRLSIITINYNNISGLRKTVDSVLAQTWRDFEWIIIDGGSTDGSKELIEEIASRPESQISYWCSEKDKGIYNAMNKGIAKANGEYLNFMNSGDCFHENTTLEQVFEGKEYDADVLYGLAEFQYKEGPQIKDNPNPITLNHLYDSTIFHQSSFIRQELLNVGYDENYKIVSDWEKWIVWLLDERSFLHIDIVVSNLDAYGISNVSPDLNMKERMTVLSELFPKAVIKELELIHEVKQTNIYYPEIKPILELLKKRRVNRRLFRILINILNRLCK